MEELISIIVPIYNGERYLNECLDSLKAQDYQNIEIMLIDDGSTDDTENICRRYASADQRFHYIYQENGGPHTARKRGVEHATGSWVLFVDADDLVTADCCSSLIARQHQTCADMVFGKLQRFQSEKYGKESKVLQGVLSGEEVLTHLLKPRPFDVSVSCTMYPILYNKKIIQDVLRNMDLRIRFAEDEACTIACLRYAKCVSCLPQVIYFYRQSEVSCCHTHTKSCVIDQKLFRFFTNHVVEGTLNEKIIRKELDWMIVWNLLLAGYEFFWDFPGIYPFGEITSGKRIVIYGAGVFGEEIHDKFPQNLTLSGWVDKQADLYQSQGKQVSFVEDLKRMTFDYIVIAVINPEIVDEIEQELQDMHIPAEKILRIKEQWIDSDYTKKKMQELENVDEDYRYVPSAISLNS
ncbi:glycosyltransferase family 2 protein [Lachnospiraceae bacterium YH-ros2226]